MNKSATTIELYKELISLLKAEIKHYRKYKNTYKVGCLKLEVFQYELRIKELSK